MKCGEVSRVINTLRAMATGPAARCLAAMATTTGRSFNGNGRCVSNNAR